MMERGWQTVTRALRIGVVLFPMWLSYALPFVRARQLLQTVPPEVWARKHRRWARRFYALAVGMRGGLIKVGQIMSTRVDLLPPEWTEELSGLQDQVTPRPWSEVERRLEAEYEQPVSALFEHLAHEAVAAASFGQVHRGTTRDGRDVALKIKYPQIELKLAVDMWLFGIAQRLFAIFLPNVDIAGIYVEVRRALTTELDYEQEARFTRIVHRNFSDRDDATIPEVLDALTTRNVICTTWFEGSKITSPAVLSDPRLDRRQLLERLLSTWVSMMYVDGVFQSDPHPGNLLVRVEDDGVRLCVVDFGQVKILDQAFHQKLVASVMAFAMNQVDAFMGSMVTLGLFPETEVEKLRPTVADLLGRLRAYKTEGEEQLDFRRLRREVLGAVNEMDGVVIPQDLVLYGRTFALLAGVTRAVAPEINAIAVARPLVTQALLAGGPPSDPTAPTGG